MNWTHDSPKTVGYYWLNHYNNDPMLVIVNRHPTGLRFALPNTQHPNIGVSVEVVSSEALWAGPILPPPRKEE